MITPPRLAALVLLVIAAFAAMKLAVKVGKEGGEFGGGSWRSRGLHCPPAAEEPVSVPSGSRRSLSP